MSPFSSTSRSSWGMLRETAWTIRLWKKRWAASALRPISVKSTRTVRPSSRPFCLRTYPFWASLLMATVTVGKVMERSWAMSVMVRPFSGSLWMASSMCSSLMLSLSSLMFRRVSSSSLRMVWNVFTRSSLRAMLNGSITPPRIYLLVKLTNWIIRHGPLPVKRREGRQETRR
ncbi:hypothetical protein SDC9_205303 [bioreactor metagenome]|uniref:Uncharacterized protein n=1 Tax=bioreactor metagenome TaxID=1076179 RepID=A0A645J4I9_9ZZZZ